MLLGNFTDIAVERLKTFEDAALEKSPDGYYVAYSGGKDSDVILDLVRRSGVKYTAHHNLTTCDAPELVRHVKTQEDVTIHRPAESMWQLIRRKKMPPRRNARFCCEVLKEGGGADRIVVTGVRWGESTRRSKRRMIETCYRDKSKQFLNLIIDWSTSEVWSYLRDNKIRYCSLYDEGFKRLGCVLCPMTRDVAMQMARWPKLCKAWEKAVKATWKPEPKKMRFATPEKYWQWWLDRDAPSNKDIDGQMMFFED